VYDVGCRRMNPTVTLTDPAPTLNFVKQETPLILLDTGEYYILYSEINKNDSDKYLNTITAIYDLMDINLEKHITPYDVKNMEILLKNDADLYLNFMKFKKRQKSEAIFIYLRKYNENHPFYLPIIK